MKKYLLVLSFFLISNFTFSSCIDEEIKPESQVIQVGDESEEYIKQLVFNLTGRNVKSAIPWYFSTYMPGVTAVEEEYACGYYGDVTWTFQNSTAFHKTTDLILSLGYLDQKTGLTNNSYSNRFNAGSEALPIETFDKYFDRYNFIGDGEYLHFTFTGYRLIFE